MYAVVFDLDTQTLEATYGGASWRNAYNEVRRALSDHGFDWQQGSTYFGNDKVDAVTCVIAVQDLTERFAWFAPSVRDIRMLRIEENNDLMPAIVRVQARNRPAN
jgi:virulence-associated protein VapD